MTSAYIEVFCFEDNYIRNKYTFHKFNIEQFDVLQVTSKLDIVLLPTFKSRALQPQRESKRDTKDIEQV